MAQEDTLRFRIVELEALVERLERERTTLADRWLVAREALRALKRGDCWCEMATGNPMVSIHSHACQQARFIVEGLPTR